MTPKTKINIKVALLLLCIAAFLAVIIGMISGCAVKPVYAPAPIYRAKSDEIPPPFDPCETCTNNCWTNSPLPFIDTNGVWLEVVSVDLSVSPALIVTRAHNLTNGVTYYWERTGNAGIPGGWIPLTSFVATGPIADRTNGIAVPDYHFWRLRWVQ